MTQEHISTLRAPEANVGTLTPSESCKKGGGGEGFYLQTVGLEQQGSPSSHKSRFINRAGTLHSVTRSSLRHWSNPKCSYSTQPSRHSTCLVI